jgi:alkylation response protein AidB-like acyl-CoA dehydrogenase
MDEVDARIEPSWWTATGMRASLNGKVDFSGVVLDESWFIGNRNDYLRQPWLTLGVVRFAAVQLGGVQALVETTRAFLKKLGRTEDPYQLARMGKMTVAMETGRLWIESAGRKIRQFNPIFGGEPSLIKSSVELIAYANMVRTIMEQLAMEVIRDAERCLGTRGLLPPEPMERNVRDLRLYLRQPCFDAAIVNSGVFGFSQQPM